MIKQKILIKDELPHYARKTTDLYFEYHFGEGEVCSISDRGGYDIANHQQKSGKNFSMEGQNPQVIEVAEISFGVERLMLAILESSYHQEDKKEDSKEIKSTRQVLKIFPLLAPYFLAVFPLSKQLNEKSYQVYLDLLPQAFFTVTYEKTGNIGKRYHRQDAIGTYYCLTVDFQTLKDNTATIRQRDSREQRRVDLTNLANLLNQEYHNYYREFLEK